MDAPRPLTRAQLAAFLKDHQAIRTMERMSQQSLVDMPGALEDLAQMAATSDARISQAIAATNRLAEAIESLLLAPGLRESKELEDISPLPPAFSSDCCPDLAPPPLQVSGTAPTGLVGPTATAGSANNYIRSDGAPAINLTATYAWTGPHTFSTTVGVAGIASFTNAAADLQFPSVLISSARPVMIFRETDQAADDQNWGQQAQGGAMEYRVVDATAGVTRLYWRITRSGVAAAALTWGNTTDNPTYAFTGSGTATFSGQVTALRFVPTSSTVATNGMYLSAANTVGLSANSTLSARYTSTTFETVLQTLLSGVESPAQFTANTDNYALGNVTALRVSTDASRNLTGMTGGVAGRFLILLNVGAQPIVIVNDATSTAANRFLLASGTNTTIQGGGCCIFWYDTTSSRWRDITRIA